MVFGEFVDYKSGVLYPNSDSLDSQNYWKKMSEVFSEFRKYDSGNTQRKHLRFGKESIKYVGKEINELESSVVFGVSKEDSIIYENEQEKIRRFIENLTEERARELGIPRRTFYDWKRKLKENKIIHMKNKTQYYFYT